MYVLNFAICILLLLGKEQIGGGSLRGNSNLRKIQNALPPTITSYTLWE